jgi:hypothetical protein
MGLADVGSVAYRARVASPGPAGVGATTIGFTNPMTISTEIQAIDVAADSLLQDFARDVPAADGTRQAFEAWRLKVWKPFRDKNLGVGRLGTGIVFGTDELMAQTQARRSDLEGFAQKYQVLAGKPPSTPIPVDPRVQPPQPGGQPGGQPSGAPSWWPKFLPNPPQIEIPWWVWVGGTVVVAGGGYLAYRAWKTTQENVARQQAEVFKILPSILGARDEPSAISASAQESGCSCPTCTGGG